MKLSKKDLKVLQIALDCKEYISSYRNDVYERIMGKDALFEDDYDLIMSLVDTINTKNDSFDHLQKILTDELEYGTDELICGTLDTNFGRELPLISRILFRIENIDRQSTVNMAPLPDFAENF